MDRKVVLVCETPRGRNSFSTHHFTYRNQLPSGLRRGSRSRIRKIAVIRERRLETVVPLGVLRGEVVG